MIKQAEVQWHLNDICSMDCVYCPSRFKGSSTDRSLEEYLVVVRKLQESRYKHVEKINWKLGGGEPLQFPGISILLNEIKKRPSNVRLDTSGGQTWFEIMALRDLFDHIKFTQHTWQNPSVLNFAIDFCKDEGKRLSVVVPLMPGKVNEGKAYVQELIGSGVEAYEQVLWEDARVGAYWSGYSTGDINLLNGLPEDWVPPPPPVKDPNEPDPAWIDPRIIKNPEFVYTGKQCYAGVDYIFIGSRGFASASDCGGRELGNVFKNDWVAPDTSFACNMMQCLSENDRKRIRVNQ